MNASSKKLLRERGRQQHKGLQLLLNRLDIIDVMPGAPDDEYDGLNGRILGMLMDDRSRTELIRTIDKEAREYYGIELPNKHLEEFVDKVLAWWNETKQ